MTKKTRELQYCNTFEVEASEGRTKLGLMTNQVWHDDPKRFLFVLARYKFVAKMFSGLDRVLEVGCADAYGTRVVRQETKHVTAVDFDPVFIEDVKERMNPKWKIDCFVHDMLEGPVPPENYDGAYAMDVIEHIPEKLEEKFIGNMAASLRQHGVMIIGSPSINSQAYASPTSKEGHINCKDGAGLKKLMQKFFHNVFIFSMNDEVVHTGFAPMAHYLIALCGDKK